MKVERETAEAHAEAWRRAAASLPVAVSKSGLNAFGSVGRLPKGNGMEVSGAERELNVASGKQLGSKGGRIFSSSTTISVAHPILPWTVELS